MASRVTRGARDWAASDSGPTSKTRQNALSSRMERIADPVTIIGVRDIDWQRLEREVRRVHERYQVEVVEALALCPWAKQARSDGRVRLGVSFMAEPDPALADAAIEQVMSSDIEV